MLNLVVNFVLTFNVFCKLPMAVSYSVWIQALGRTALHVFSMLVEALK